MDTDVKVSAEELAAEQVAVQIPKEEDVRAEIITEYGFDESIDGERIDKLVSKEIESKKMLSKTIAQKIKHRTEAEELRKKSSVIPPAAEKKDSDLSSKDIIALTKAGVADEDIDEIIDYAKYKKISIAEALKSQVITISIKEKEEQRKAAAAQNTGAARRGSVKTSDEEVVAQVERGLLPEDPEVLARARMAMKKKGNR